MQRNPVEGHELLRGSKLGSFQFCISIHALLVKICAVLVVTFVITDTSLADTKNKKQTELEIVSRSDWKARPPLAALMIRQIPKEIVIHHTSVQQQLKLSVHKKMRSLQSFSQKKGKVGMINKPIWGDVPYHFYIAANGSIAEGRGINFQGDSNTNYNLSSKIHIAVEGHFDREKPSKGQLISLKRLTKHLLARYGISGSKISGHNDHASTDCPGIHLKSFITQLRKISINNSSKKLLDGSLAVNEWKEIRNTKDQGELEAFIKKYPDSFYADLARIRVEQLHSNKNSNANTNTESLNQSPTEFNRSKQKAYK